MGWKMVKHGEKGCGDVSVEASENFVRFMFNKFKSHGPDHYAELIDPEGNVVAAIPADRKQ